MEIKALSGAFKPFGKTSSSVFATILLVECVVALSAWQASGGGLIPTPSIILHRFGELLLSGEFYDNLVASAWLTTKGTAISIAIAMVLAWASCIPAFKPTAELVTKLRYMTLTGLMFAFAIIFRDGATLKISLLLFGIVPFLTTSMMSVVASVPQAEIDLCTTLRMSPWRTMWEVVILGRRDESIEVIRQNFAIAWMMITMVEGASMSEGGIGTMLIKSNKYIDLATVFPLLIAVLLIGVGADYFLRSVRPWIFPYVK